MSLTVYDIHKRSIYDLRQNGFLLWISMAEIRNCQITSSGTHFELKTLSSGLAADSSHKPTDEHVHDLHIKCYFLLHKNREEPGYVSV
jgi:hypothetical protein